MTDTTVLSRREGLSADDGDGYAVLVDNATGKYYSLGELGGRIWALLEEPATLGALIGMLTEEFDVTAGQCRADILPFLAALVNRGLLREEG